MLEMIGNELRRRRRSRDLTQKQVGEMFGISSSNIAKIEAGKNNNLEYFIFAYICNFDIIKYKNWRP